MQTESLTNWIKQRAAELGFAMCGIAPAVAPPGTRRLEEWLAAGYAGSMHYLAERKDAYADPNRILDGVRSVVMLATPYSNVQPSEAGPLSGRVARYASGSRDYHDVIRERLHLLSDELKGRIPTAHTRGVVDTAPLLERDFARMAGLGWIGKNTLLLNKNAGSYFFLAGLLTDLELEYDAAYRSDHCGSCTACLDACPTDAFPQPYVLDARRCISYLTIETQEPIPLALRAGLGDWVFGCDICQEVCPWNRHSQPEIIPELSPEDSLNPLSLPELFEMREEEFKARFRHTPLWRAHRRGLLRSAAIVLGNQRNPTALPALIKGLDDPEAVVRAAAAWALGQLATPAAIEALERHRACESDPTVLEEITASLDQGLNDACP